MIPFIIWLSLLTMFFVLAWRFGLLLDNPGCCLPRQYWTITSKLDLDMWWEYEVEKDEELRDVYDFIATRNSYPAKIRFIPYEDFKDATDENCSTAATFPYFNY